MGNYEDAKIGKRIKLISKMVNKGSLMVPEENLPVGMEGTITHVNFSGNDFFHQIMVNWDNGRILAVLPYEDEYEILS